ncbi:MAG TPA: hypothetical protein VK969_07935 [Acidimicrobiia bacterium]|nr:hypothetical protein [Acidimicrobiia bacterium]
MQFKGQLLLPDDTGPGLKVSLDVAAHHLAVQSDDGGLGAWPLEVVDVERSGDVFALTVAGELLQFRADDTIAFAYSGVPAIEEVSGRTKGRSSLRSMFDRIWNGPPNTEEPAPTEPAPPAESGAVVEPDSAELPVLSSVPPPAIAEASEDLAEDRAEVPTPTGVEETREWPELASSPGCPAVRSDGRRCESPILTSSGYCYPHDPKRAFEDKYQSAQEARAQLKRDSTARLNRIYTRLDKAMRQVENGELEPETAMAMAQLAHTMCAIVEMDEPSEGVSS